MKLRMPHVFVLLAVMICIASAATYVVPSGKYERVKQVVAGLTKNVVVPESYAPLPKHVTVRGVLIGDAVPDDHAAPVSVIQLLSAIPRGLMDSSDIVFFIFIVGGVFGILQATGAITAALRGLADVFKDAPVVLTLLVMLAVGIGGSTLGMGEEFIPLVPLFLMLSRRMGYDRIYGLCLVMLAADMGFASATTNPFTINIAQSIAGLPLNSGWSLRAVFFVCAMTLTIVHVLRYGARIKRDPAASLVSDQPFEVHDDNLDDHRFETRHAFILLSVVVIFAGILVAVKTLDWWLDAMAGCFLLMGVVAAVIGRLSLDTTASAFVKGMQEMVVAAMVVGFAHGIEVVLTDGQILDTLIYHAATTLQEVPKALSVQGMLVFQSTLNFLVPSGSGQAAVTMPIMAPLADLLGITRQTAVLAYQFGDGFSNTIVPTSGVLMAMLALAGVPYGRWLRFVLPLFIQLMLLSAVFLMIAVRINYQ